jgi:hypothetical protein
MEDTHTPRPELSRDAVAALRASEGSIALMEAPVDKEVVDQTPVFVGLDQVRDLATGTLTMKGGDEAFKGFDALAMLSLDARKVG